MKKFLVGCGVFVLILLILVTGLGLLLGVKINRFKNSVETNAATMKKLESDFAFKPPKLPLLNETRFVSYLKVRRAVMDMLLENPAIKKIVAIQDGTSKKPEMKFGDILSMFPLVNQVMEKASGELRKEQMSPSEYLWNMRVTVETLRDGARRGDPRMKAMATTLMEKLDGLDMELKRNPQFQTVHLDTEIDLDPAGTPPPAPGAQAEDTAPTDTEAPPAPEAPTAPGLPVGLRPIRIIPPENIEILGRHMDELEKDVDCFALELAIENSLDEARRGIEQGNKANQRRRLRGRKHSKGYQSGDSVQIGPLKTVVIHGGTATEDAADEAEDAASDAADDASEAATDAEEAETREPEMVGS